MGRLISFDTALEITGVSRRTLRRWMEKHKINASQIPSAKGYMRVFLDSDDVVYMVGQEENKVRKPNVRNPVMKVKKRKKAERKGKSL